MVQAVGVIDLNLDRVSELSHAMMEMAQAKDVEPEEYVAACVLVLISFRDNDPDRCDAIMLAMRMALLETAEDRKEKKN